MPLLREIGRLAAQGSSFVIATVVETDGSSPQKPGARLVLEADGTLHGTIGGGAIEHRVLDAARALLADAARCTQMLHVHLTHDLGMCCGGAMCVFLEKHAPSERVVVFGAGHVARALASFAAAAGFRVTVVDGRAELLTQERFPCAERVHASPAEYAAAMADDESLAAAAGEAARTFACVMTHDHQLDHQVVTALLKRPGPALGYVGMIGSRRKAERCRQRLVAEGHAPEAIERLRSPMGVEIGAQSPEEIALSIAAELVAVRRRLGGGCESPPPPSSTTTPTPDDPEST